MASVTLDASLRPAWLLDAGGDRLDPRVLGWVRIPADDAPLDPPDQDRSSALTTALEIGGAVAAGAATGWSPGGSGEDEFVRPESWGGGPHVVRWSGCTLRRCGSSTAGC